MIEGTLKDASLPGLLQFLATETNKLYKVKLSAGGQSGEIYLNNGHIIRASFNLLDGEDALCEFLSWREGMFWVERLAGEFEATVKKNMNLRLHAPTTFVAQSAFLNESNVGLNTAVVPSKKFGSIEWQDAMRTQPLEREDFVVLGWLKEGRTLRQAAREFGFDIVKATNILYRLLLTHSIEVLRTGSELVESGSFPLEVSEADKLAKPNKVAGQSKVDMDSIRTSMDRLKKGLRPQDQYGEGQSPGIVRPAAAHSAEFAQASGDMFNAVGGAGGPALSALGSFVEAAAYATGVVQEEKEKQATALNGQAEAMIDCAPDVIAPPPSSTESEEDSAFSARRTEALPLVTIDIERLLQATFTATQFGKLALTNQALDQHLRQTLLDVETGKSLQVVVGSSVRTPASVLSTYRFCLARGYVISSDPVIPLTADLLLGRIELDQYLLQRRRINGDELRDLIEIQRQKGVKLADLLVKHGYLTSSDLTRLTGEQKRFALK